MNCLNYLNFAMSNICPGCFKVKRLQGSGLFHQFCECGVPDSMATDNVGYEVSLVKCDLCNHKWTAVRIAGLEILQCPNCKNMVNFENLIT